MIEVRIEEIINYLEGQKYNYTFTGDIQDTISGFSTLFNYKENTLTFVSSLNNFKDYEDTFRNSSIKLIISSPEEKVHPCFVNVIQVEKPKFVFFTLLDYFFDRHNENQRNIISNEKEIYEKHSYISSAAKVGENVKIGIGCIIEDNVVIGEDTVIHHNVVIRQGTKIGNHCTILSGVVIGETGFNPLKKDDGTRNIIKHYGGVTIGNNVHIGDNCSISKGTIDDTTIGEGVKLNKQVIIAHNVTVGTDTVFTAPTFICGSVIIGDNCHIAATTIRNQCTIGDNAVLGLGSVVVKDVAPGTTVVGNPAKPLK